MKYWGPVAWLVTVMITNVAQAQYTAELHPGFDNYLHDPTEFWDSLVVDVYYGSTLQNPNPSWYYMVYANLNDLGWHTTECFGYGRNRNQIDGNCWAGYSYQYKYLVVIGADSIWSNEVPGPTFDNTGLLAHFDAYYNSSSLVGSNVSIAEYCGPDWIGNSDNIGPNDFWLQYSTTNNPYAVMRVAPFYVSSLSCAFHDWTTSAPATAYDNFHFFTVNSSISPITGNFLAKVSATIRDSLVDGSNNVADSIQFFDPWLVDSMDQRYNDAKYGYHNLATGALFKTESSPLNLTVTSKHKGLFKGQTIVSGKPYYAARAPLVKTISGYTAFFVGWIATNASLSDGGPNSNGYDSTAIVDTADNAVVTAEYSYYTLSANRTIPSGTNTMAGTLTINSGVTLTVSSGATLNFPSGAKLVVNGSLQANGATFNFTQGSYNYDSGIEIDANGSSLTSCTISGADRPLYFNGVTSATVSGGTINNSDFASSQAILVSGGTPTIDDVEIAGGSGSSNGVRYTNGGGGTLSNCHIHNLGAGNGITIQGNCSAMIKDNYVNGNHYDGYMITGPTSSNPTLKHNIFDSNGILYGSTRYYNGIVVYYYAAGLITCNTVENSNWGITAYVYSSPTAGDIDAVGGNTVTNNQYGLFAYDNSLLKFGGGDPHYGHYWGICNNIYGNATVDAIAQSSSGINARYNYWGQSPPDSSKILNDAGSYIDYTYYLTDWADCPINNPKRVAKGPLLSTTVTSDNPTLLMRSATDEFAEKDYAGAAALFKLVLADTSASSLHQEALSQLYSVFQASHDTTIIETFASLKSSRKDLEESTTELLAAALTGSGRLSEAQAVANELRTGKFGTEAKKKGLVLLTSLRSFDRSYSQVSKAAFAQLVKEFGTSPDRAWLVGVRLPEDVALPPETTPSANSSTKTDSSGVTLASYPNPFNPTTRIQFAVRQAGFVSLKVYDMLGREVATLVNEAKTVGTYNVDWNASQLASGIYFARFEAAGKVAIQKLMYLK